MTPRPSAPQPWLALALGVAVLSAGLGFARIWLPEWRQGPPPGRAFFLQRFAELSRRLGFEPGPAPAAASLATHDSNLLLNCAPPDEPVVANMTHDGTGVCVEVRQEGTLPGAETPRELAFELAPDGTPRAVLWTMRKRAALTVRIESPQAPPSLQTALLGILLPPGQTLGPPQRGLMGGIAGVIYPLPGRPGEHVRTQISQTGSYLAFLQPGDPRRAYLQSTAFTAQDTFDYAVPLLFAFTVVAFFFVLLGRGRIDLVNGTLLAAFVFLALAPALPPFEPATGAFQARLIHVGLLTLWVLIVWSTGESLLRSQHSAAVAGLDALRAGRLGPRGGRAVLLGLGCGLGLAGLSLLLTAAAAALPGVRPHLPTVWFPFYDRWSNPILGGVVLAGTISLCTALASRVLPSRWALPGAALAAAFLTLPVPVDPPLAGLLCGWLFTAALAALAWREGLAALLVAAVSQALAPAAIYTLASGWEPWTAASTSALLLAFFGVGAAGLRRSAGVEAARLRPPAFIRRLEEERRLRYEMDLLARMQEGLLPESLPKVAGWRIAARSLLATEAGGDLYNVERDESGALWVAVGDVAGHGYSCAIVQAMTTAALSSFIAQGRGPAEVLRSVDRVIRRGRSGPVPRNFTSLALIRIDPATGEAVLANAGHPYPLLAVPGGDSAGPAEVTELALPGLPLGQGPDRLYREHTFTIPPGATLLLYSDGLVEAADAAGTPYGFDRPREVLREVAGQPAYTLLHALLKDWQSHLGGGEPPDDTTVVVVKRAGEATEAAARA